MCQESVCQGQAICPHADNKLCQDGVCLWLTICFRVDAKLFQERVHQGQTTALILIKSCVMMESGMGRQSACTLIK